MERSIPLTLNFLGKLFKKTAGAVKTFAKSSARYAKRVAKKISQPFLRVQSPLVLRSVQ